MNDDRKQQLLHMAAERQLMAGGEVFPEVAELLKEGLIQRVSSFFELTEAGHKALGAWER
jgi:hypothetical protein